MEIVGLSTEIFVDGLHVGTVRTFRDKFGVYTQDEFIKLGDEVLVHGPEFNCGAQNDPLYTIH